jgi:hypothetical protein
MTEIFGVKRVYGFCLLGTAILTLLSPVAAKLHVGAFIAVRVLQGGRFFYRKCLNIIFILSLIPSSKFALDTLPSRCLKFLTTYNVGFKEKQLTLEGPV